MATIDKNFRVKHGLVVEGATGTINGNAILTENGGDSYILNLVGGATLVKSVDSVFSVDNSGNLTLNYGNGLTKSGSNLTVDTSVIASKTYVDNAISDAIATDTYTNGTGLSLSNNQFSINRSVVDGWYDEAGAASQAETNANSYTDSQLGSFGNQTSSDIADAITTAENYADSLAANYDAAGSAANAETAAKNYADSLASNYDAAGAASSAETAAKNYADSLASNYDAAGAASSAQTAAQNYADSLASNYDAAGSASTAYTNAVADANSYTDTQVADLVNGAPALLDTLKELADAIGNDPSLASNIATSIGEKVAKSGDTMTGALTLSGAPTVDLHAATKKYVDDAKADAENYTDSAVSSAQTAAENYADSLASNYDAAGAASSAQAAAESYADGLSGDILDGTSAFSAINVNTVAKVVAASAAVATAGTANAVSWDATEYRTAKALVKFATSGHSQVSEVLLTMDVNNNIAITEYAEVGTNGELGTVTASYSSGTVSIQVTTLQDNTNVMVYATLLV